MSEHKGTYNIAALRLSHIPTVTTNGKLFAVWTDIKELLLWCADTHCCIVLEALNQLECNSFVHACSIQEYQSFSKQYVYVKPGTCLVDVEIFQNPDILSFLHSCVRKKHLESDCSETSNCIKMLQVISAKYANTSFKIPLRMASHMQLLPALRRGSQICDYEGSTEKLQSCSVTAESVTQILVPLALLADLYPESTGFLNETVKQYVQGLHEPGSLPSICQCSVEEGIQLTRFVSCYRGYGSSWSCFTSNSLLIAWTEFLNRLDNVTKNKLYPKLSNTGVIILNCESIPNTARQTNISSKLSVNHSFMDNEGQRYTEVNESCNDDTGGIQKLNVQLITDSLQSAPSKKNKERIQNLQLDRQVADGKRNKSKSKSVDDNGTNTKVMKSKLSRHENKTVEGVVTRKGRKLNSANHSESQSDQERLSDKHKKDINNSATKRCIGGVLTKPGCGDNAEMEVKLKNQNRKEILQLSKLTISNTNTGLSKEIKANAGLVKADKNVKDTHIVVPVCDNDTKTDFSMSEVSGYDLSSMVPEEIDQGIHVSITRKRNTSIDEQHKHMSDTHITKRKDEGERKYLKLSTAFINDDMPEAFRCAEKIPATFVVKTSLTNEGDVLNSSNLQNCENLDYNEKPKYTSVTPKQLEITTPMLHGIHVDPNKIQENRKFPYKPVRSDHKQPQENPVIQCPNLTPALAANLAVPVIEGTQICVKSAAEKPSVNDKSIFYHAKTILAPVTNETSRKSPVNQHENIHENKVKITQSHTRSGLKGQLNDQTGTSGQFIATGKVVKTFERTTDFNSSEFMKERITMWRDSVQQALNPNKTGRLTKSAEFRRSRQTCTNRPLSSVYCSFGAQFERENQAISSSVCPLTQSSRELNSPESCYNKLCDNTETNNYSEPVKQRHYVEVQNYGSSSSTTPDIYDEFARKRRPKQLKPDTVQIKPKPVTRPIPSTLCQPVVRKTPAQTVTSKPSTPNHNTVGYISSKMTRPIFPKTWLVNKADDVNSGLKQSYHHSNNAAINNVYHDSKSSEFKGLVSTVPNNTNSNTSCSYSACSLNKKEMKRKVPSAKKERKPFVPEFCKFVERPQTAKMSSVLYSDSSINCKLGQQESESKSSSSDNMVSCLNKPADEMTRIEETTERNIGCTVTGYTECKKSLLDKMTSFVNSYVSPKKTESLEDINSIHSILSTNPLQGMSFGELDRDFVNEAFDNKCKPKNYCESKDSVPDLEHYRYSSLNESESTGQVLSKVDSQLYYKIPEDSCYHRVTGNMVIPPNAQFFIQSRGTSETTLSVNSSEMIVTEDNAEDINPTSDKYVDSLDANSASSHSKLQNSDTDTKDTMGKENDKNSEFDKILMTSNNFVDKVEQMKHIIHETQQAIQRVNEPDEAEELTDVKKVNSDENNPSFNQEEIDHGRNDPIKVISPSHGLELTKKITSKKKKSFKEVVEEKREQRKRTEKELSKKKFWNSAHSKMEKTEPKSIVPGKDKPKPIQKERIGISRITSGRLRSQQNAVPFKSDNQPCGRNVDDVIKTKKGATTGQRLKTTATKLTAKESRVKHNPNEIGSMANRSKSTISATRNNQVKSAINSNDQKQRVSKSAGQFPKKRGTSINQKDGCIDDCTNKILTALRRLSIEKSPKKDIYISPKLDARQRKLRSCVVKKLIAPKYCSDKSNMVKRTNECSDKLDKLNEKSAADDLGPTDLLENNESSACEKPSTNDKEQTHSNSFTKDCFVSLTKLSDLEIRKQDSSKTEEDIPCNEVSLCVEKTNPSSQIIDYVNNDQTVNEENIEEKTFITKFKVNEGSEKTEFGDSLIVDEKNGNPYMTLNKNDKPLNNVNVNCKTNEALKAEESIHMNQNVENPVQIYLNASKEQNGLLGAELMHSDTKPDIFYAFCQNRIETPNTTEHTYDDYKMTSRRMEDATNDYAVDNIIKDGKTENDINECGEETFLYSEDVDSTDGLQDQLFWIEKEHFADDVATSHVELICLNDQFYDGETNVVNFIDNVADEHEFNQDLKDGHLFDKYLGLQVACGGSGQIDTSATKTTITTENDIHFFDDTECGEEVNIETDDTDAQSVPSIEDNSNILHHDVCINGKADDENVEILQLDTDIVKSSAELSEDIPDVGKPGKNKKKQRGNDNCLDVCDKEESNAQFIGDPSLYSNKISPSQSEMEAYFEKVAERARLNPFSDFCQNGTSDTGANILESEAYTNDELHSKANQGDVNKDKKGKDDDASLSDHSDDDLHVFDSKSDDADKDYNPDIDSYSGTDIEDDIGASQNIKSIVKTKSKKKRKSVKSEDKNKAVNFKKVSSEEEMWKKYLKDSNTCNKKVHKDKKASKPRSRPEDGNKQYELESSIVREYCHRHAESEETSAQLKTKLWKEKHLTKETESATSGNMEADRKNTKSDPAKKLRKKSKLKQSRKSKAFNDYSDDEKKEREETKAAEGFIKTQKLYFNILKKSSIGQCKPDYEDDDDIGSSSTRDLPEVLEAVAVHGERSISKAESDAEKALEGTGSLDNMLAEDEGTIIVDLTNQCRYQLIEDEDHVQLGGIAYFKDFQLPFVYNNGYKYTPVKDIVRLFQARSCATKCTIPRKVLQKYKTLVKSYSTWEQVYKLELIKLQKGPTVVTGDMLVKLDSLLSLLPEIINTIRQQHKGTKLKNSQSCSMDGYKNLLSSLV